MPFNPPPEPSYEKDVNKLIQYYRKAVRDIVYELGNFDLNALDAAMRKKLLQEIESVLKDLDKNALEWVEEYIPKAYREGQAAALVSIGEAATIAEATKLISFSNLNRHMISAFIEDTYNDLLMATQNTRRKVKQTVREVVSEQLRSKATQNLGRKTMTRDTVKELREKLTEAGTFAIRDSSNRKWSIERYTDMVVRTKIQQAHVEGVRNEATGREVYYGVISSHGSQDPCRFHEGRLVRLTNEAPGSYPTISELKASGQIFHPNCKHSVHPVRDKSLLPKSLQEKAERQAERGDKAIATGKRNPKDID